MKVRLLKDVINKDRHGNDAGLQVVRRPNRPTVAYTAGVIIDCSEATGAKFIERGLAEAVTEQQDEPGTDIDEEDE